MFHRRKIKPQYFDWGSNYEPSVFEQLQYAAACKLCVWHEHESGSGSAYITIGDRLKLRFADHKKTSAQYDQPDFNFVDREPTEQEVKIIIEKIQYARLCKKTAFAMHVGLTVPKLKKLLTPSCYELVCENEAYPNTLTEYVIVAAALELLETAGENNRIPVRQELYTLEDYYGGY